MSQNVFAPATPTGVLFSGVVTLDLAPGAPVLHARVAAGSGDLRQEPVPLGDLMNSVLARYGLNRNDSPAEVGQTAARN